MNGCRKAVARATPALLALAAFLLAGNLGQLGSGQRAKGWGSGPLEKVLLASPVSPLTIPRELPCPVVEELVGISKRAAALTGSLALLEKGDRPHAAFGVATQVRALQRRAEGLPGGLDLAWGLGDLSEAVEKYARGDPGAIGNVREASARNARVRKALEQQQLNCGGQTDE